MLRLAWLHWRQPHLIAGTIALAVSLACSQKGAIASATKIIAPPPDSTWAILFETPSLRFSIEKEHQVRLGETTVLWMRFDLDSMLYSQNGTEYPTVHIQEELNCSRRVSRQLRMMGANRAGEGVLDSGPIEGPWIPFNSNAMTSRPLDASCGFLSTPRS